VARVAAAKAAATAPQAPQTPTATPPVVAPVTPLTLRRRVRLDPTPDEDDPRNDPAAEDGRFA
jgi:hypothetical protein